MSVNFTPWNAAAILDAAAAAAAVAEASASAAVTTTAGSGAGVDMIGVSERVGIVSDETAIHRSRAPPPPVFFFFFFQPDRG